MLGILLRQKTAVSMGGIQPTQSPETELAHPTMLVSRAPDMSSMVAEDGPSWQAFSHFGVTCGRESSSDEQDATGPTRNDGNSNSSSDSTRSSLCRSIYSRTGGELRTCSSRPYNSSSPELLRQYLVYRIGTNSYCRLPSMHSSSSGIAVLAFAFKSNGPI